MNNLDTALAVWVAAVCIITVIGGVAISFASRRDPSRRSYVSPTCVPTPPVPGADVTSTWEGVVVYDRDEVGKVTVTITDGTFFDAVVPSRGAWIAMQAGQRVRGVRDEKGKYIVTGFVPGSRYAM